MGPQVNHELLIRDVTVDGRPSDVLVRGDTIVAVGPGLRPTGDAEVVDGSGGALIPGLHDHHIHLLATAAARSSLQLGPADVRGTEGLATALARRDSALPEGSWLRAVGYHESVAGPLDRERLDALVPDRPVRVQHRTGAQWILNSAALTAIGLTDASSPTPGTDTGGTAEHGADPPGIERDDSGRLTGRLHRTDDWLRARLPDEGPPDLATLGADLAAVGITGVTDATPFRSIDQLAPLAASVADGALPQRVVVMGGLELADRELPPGLERGPVKLVIDDAEYPALDDLEADIRAAHARGRPVAIHCVTRTSLTLAVAAWQAAGSRTGDRIEHGSVIPAALVPELARLGLTVVTQPAFVAERGDQYLADVDPEDLPHLYRCRSLMDAGIEVAASSDAPYTSIDPWRAMQAAICRRTASGTPLGSSEAVPAHAALSLYLGDPAHPGGPPRRVEVGARADLVLLDGPLPTTPAQFVADRIVRSILPR